MPFLRYQTPSRVRQTSSASILPPLVRSIVGLLPLFVPMPGPLVETGATLVVVCEVATRVGDCFAVGEGTGEGETEGDGEGDGEGGAGVSSTTATGLFVDACVCSVFLPELKKRKAPTMPRITTATGIKSSFRFLRRGLVADSISESATTTRGV